jgi:hypothetical protein
MNFASIRVRTDKQMTENQSFESYGAVLVEVITNLISLREIGNATSTEVHSLYTPVSLGEEDIQYKHS